VFCKDANSLGIVIFIHNLEFRGTFRLRNLLYSIRNQEDTVLNPNIIVVDQSNDNSYRDISKFCKEFNAEYVYSKLQGEFWCKGLCLNFGIKKLKNPFIACMDVDNILAPNFFKTVQEEASESKLLICKVWKSSPKLDLTNFKMKDYIFLLSKCKYTEARCANGACQLANRTWWYKIKGYNENLLKWGTMDNELVAVAKLSGLIVQWINNKTSILHQYHDLGKDREQHLKNKEKYKQVLVTKTIKRNDNWGELFVTKEERNG